MCEVAALGTGVCQAIGHRSATQKILPWINSDMLGVLVGKPADK